MNSHNIISQNSPFSLSNLDNYFTTIQNTNLDILNKYNLLIVEYLNFIIETIREKKNFIDKFIIEQGLKTITHVFKIILYYSKNADMAYYHSQKSFYFFIEFIEQISEEHHTFLNLNSKDAILFVYKKTIYEINNDIKKISKMSDIDVKKFELLNIYVDILESVVYYSLQKTDDCLKDVYITQLKNTIVYIKNYSNILLKSRLLIHDFDTINIFTHLLNKDIDIEKYYIVIELFIKKYFKSEKIILIKEKCLDEINVVKMINDDPQKFIKWIYNI
jgi:hypothetical protein